MKAFDRFRSLAVLAADAAVMLASYYLALGLRLDFGAPAYGWRSAHLSAVLAVAMQLAALRAVGAHRKGWGRFSIADAARLGLGLGIAAAMFVALRVALPLHFWARPPFTVSLINAVVAFVAMAVARIFGAAYLAERRRRPVFGRSAEPEVTDAVRAAFADKRVMITGAGGTIGSELCRQVLRLAPARMVLVERGENALYEVNRRLAAENGGGTVLVPCLADAGDRRRMEKVFREERPEIVVHAAAYKHVPMVEMNPKEGIENNFLATLSLAEAALAHDAERFVFISTDKAVAPQNVMGMTKRLGELTMSALAGRGRTEFCAVRFGNVIGSSGSVIPLFEEQVSRGGPVTVTDARMTRYFMSVAEAVGLVLQAAASGGSRLYVLDMGEPRRITDLAEEIIRRHGYRPYVDMPVVFTGVRPGEKLVEDLGVGGANMMATGHAKIFVCREPPADIVAVSRAARDCVELCGDDLSREEVRRRLVEIVARFLVLSTVGEK